LAGLAGCGFAQRPRLWHGSKNLIKKDHLKQ
jgi:hypothetical protein